MRREGSEGRRGWRGRGVWGRQAGQTLTFVWQTSWRLDPAALVLAGPSVRVGAQGRVGVAVSVSVDSRAASASR